MTVVRMAQMVRTIPILDRRSVGRKFCDLWASLPEQVAYQSLLHENTFGLLARLIANYGSPLARQKGLRHLSLAFVGQLREKRPIPRSWMESYSSLVHRIFMQRRNRLSQQITKALCLGEDLPSVEGAYHECFDREDRISIGFLLDLGNRVFESLAARPAEVADTAEVPGNILGLAATWANNSDWPELVGHYLTMLETVASKRVPVHIVSPMIFPAFSALKRGPQESCRRFLKAALVWTPREQTEETEETTKLVVKLLAFVLQQPWLDGTLRLLGNRAFLHVLTDPDTGVKESKELFQALGELLGVRLASLHPTMGLLNAWQERKGVPEDYLAQTAYLRLSPRESQELASGIIRTWEENRDFWQYVAAALFRLGRYEDVLRVVAKMKEDRQEYPDSYGLAAAVHARDNPEAAYQELRVTIDLQEKGRPGLHPWVARLVHHQLALASQGKRRHLHLLAEELVRDRRLRPLVEVLKDPAPERSGGASAG